MQRSVPVPAIAACYALTAFAVAVVSGIAAGRDAHAVLETALLILVICYVVGVAAAHVANVAVRERLRQLRELEPVPVEDPSLVTPGDFTLDPNRSEAA